MGHGACGGCKAALTQAFVGQPAGHGGFIAHWVDMLDDARERIVAEHGMGEAAMDAMELEAVRVSLANLRTFPFVPQREAAGKLRLVGAHFAIRDGLLRVLQKSGEFAPA